MASDLAAPAAKGIPRIHVGPGQLPVYSTAGGMERKGQCEGSREVAVSCARASRRYGLVQ